MTRYWEQRYAQRDAPAAPRGIIVPTWFLETEELADLKRSAESFLRDDPGDPTVQAMLDATDAELRKRRAAEAALEQKERARSCTT